MSDNKKAKQVEKTDAPLSRFAPIADIRAALSFLTRLPVGGPHRGLDLCAWAFPFAGLVVGGVGAAAFLASVWLGLGPWLSASIAFIATAFLSGALHEDGLADAADGLFGGTTKARKLEIMRDSRMGAFGALALILVTAAKIAALVQVSGTFSNQAAAMFLLLAHTVGRSVLPFIMAWLPVASSEGVAAAVGKPTVIFALFALAIGAGVCMIFGLELGAWIFCSALLVAAGASLLVRRSLGGYNGDTLGMIEQLVETAALISPLIYITHFP